MGGKGEFSRDNAFYPGSLRGPRTFAGGPKASQGPLAPPSRLGLSCLKMLSRPPGLAFRSGVLLQAEASRPRQDRCSRLGASSQGSSHPQTQTGTRLVWTSPACRPKSNCSELEASSQGAVGRKLKASHPSGLHKSSLQTQIQLFKIGSNQSRRRRKKLKASSHPQTQTGTRLVWTSPACRPKSNCSRLVASSQGSV